MVFPSDVRGVYETSEREVVDPVSGKTMRRILVAKVRAYQVLIKAGKTPPTGDVEVELGSKDSSKDDKNRKKGERASVWISGSENFGTPITHRPDYLEIKPTRMKVTMDDGSEQIQFTFSIVLPAFANDETTPWKFVKTGTMPGGADWSTPSPKNPITTPITDPVSPIR